MKDVKVRVTHSLLYGPPDDVPSGLHFRTELCPWHDWFPDWLTHDISDGICAGYQGVGKGEGWKCPKCKGIQSLSSHHFIGIEPDNKQLFTTCDVSDFDEYRDQYKKDHPEDFKD